MSAPERVQKNFRYFLQFSALSLFNLVYLPPFCILLLITAGRLARPLIRTWGRVMLFIARIELVIEEPARRELERRRRRVITFNHTSTMDMFLITALWPPQGSAVIKKEMLYLPLMGQAMWSAKFVALDRSNREKSASSLAAAAERMRRYDLSVAIAPEGTRSLSGELQKFKLGAFHMAAAADAPIVPLVLHGAGILWPRWQRHSNRGRVTIRLLPEMPSGAEDTSNAAVHERSVRLHALYEAELAVMLRDVSIERRSL